MTLHALLHRLVSTAGRSAFGCLPVLTAASLLVTAPLSVRAQEEAPAVAATAARAAPSATGEGPALWVIRDADSTLYLFGTVHVLRPDTGWGSAKVDAAFASASDIWFEISNPDDQAAIIPLIQQYGVSPATPLSSLLTPTELADLDVAARTMDASARQMDPLRPWFAGLTLSIAPLVKAGYDPASGVELVLKARALEAGKPVHGFETIDKQVRVLATLPEAVQLEFLRSTLKDFDKATEMLDQMVGAWSAGDVETLDRVAVQDMKANAPEVYEALLVNRNADFAGRIEEILAGSGTAFIAVGAAHLAGEDSVQAMLAKRGVEVERE